MESFQPREELLGANPVTALSMSFAPGISGERMIDDGPRFSSSVKTSIGLSLHSRQIFPLLRKDCTLRSGQGHSFYNILESTRPKRKNLAYFLFNVLICLPAVECGSASTNLSIFDQFSHQRFPEMRSGIRYTGTRGATDFKPRHKGLTRMCRGRCCYMLESDR